MACTEEQHGELLKSLLDVMTDETFADLKIRLKDGEVVSVSRTVVAAMSPVFRQMLSSPMRERNEGEIELDYVSRETWDTLVAFYLTGEKRVTAGNVVEIVEVVHLLQMKSLTRHCRQVLSQSVDLENWWTFLEIANKYDFEDCIKNILCFVGRNFEVVGATDEFHKLSKKNLEDLVAISLMVKSEDSVCQAVLSWLEKNEQGDKSTEKLFRLIKLEHISAACMTESVMYHPQVLSCEAVRRKVATLVQRRYAALPVSGRLFERPAETSDSILVLGHDGTSMHGYQCSEAADQWHKLPAGRAGKNFAACMFGEFLFVTGGEGTPQSLFKLEGKTWTTGPDLVTGRWDHGMVSTRDALFVVAGDYPKGCLSSVEEFCVHAGAWETVGYLRIATASCGTAALGNTIFVVGGKVSGVSSTIQSFDTVTKTAAVLKTQLPKAVTYARGVTVKDEAVFLSHGGDLFTLKVSTEGEPSLRRTRLSGFQQSWPFGVLIDSHVKVFRKGGNVEWFSPDGNKVLWDAATLPASFQVIEVFRTKMSNI